MIATPVGRALGRLLERYLGLYRERHGTLPRQAFDEDWPSPCQVGPPDADGQIEWRPVPRASPPDFVGLENALGERLHPDVKALFGSYYSDVIPAHADEGKLQLVQVWSDADFDRLVANLIGHAMNKSRDKHPLTLFFATTDEEEYFLSVDNRGGAVLLESPGLPPVRELAPDLATFLARVEPVLDPADDSSP